MSKKLRHLTCNYPFVNCQRNYRAPGTYVNNDNANCKICEDGTQTKKTSFTKEQLENVTRIEENNEHIHIKNHQNDAISVDLVSLLLTLNNCHTLFRVSIVNFDHVVAGWKWVFLEPSQISVMELFTKMIHG